MTRAYSASRRQLATMRLAAQGIDVAPFDSPAGVVRHLLAMQAQDYPGAKWSVALRTTDSTDADVEKAIADRSIVRSWPMRGTLHFTPAEDLGWMLSLTRKRMIQSAAGRHRQLELDDAAFTAAARIAEGELAANPFVGRTDLLEAFERAGLSTAGQRGTHLLWYLNVIGLLVFGPPQGKQHGFALLDSWVTNARALDREQALAEFARRYFVSHGPATERDFAWWTSLTLTEAREGLASVAHELEPLEVDGTRYYHRPGLEPAAPGVRLLPGFDEFVLGYQDRGAQLDAASSAQVVPGGNGVFFPTIVVDGEVVGTWKRKETAKRVDVELAPFGTLAQRKRADVQRELERYGTYLTKSTRLL
jgi:hypothetical protein